MIKNLKLELYRELLKKDNKDLTDNEIDIMYTLSKDKDIQDTLERAKKWKILILLK